LGVARKRPVAKRTATLGIILQGFPERAKRNASGGKRKGLGNGPLKVPPAEFWVGVKRGQSPLGGKKRGGESQIKDAKKEGTTKTFLRGKAYQGFQAPRATAPN